MRILFIGSVAFSAHALRELIAMQAEIGRVCTLKDSAFNANHMDLVSITNDAGIPATGTQNLDNSESLEWIRERKPDVIFCFGWSRPIKAPLLGLPQLGMIGFHPAALPTNRGRYPLIWALVHRLANVWRKRGTVNGRIDCLIAAESIHNLVRGLARPSGRVRCG